MDKPQDVDLVALLPEPLPDDVPVVAAAEEPFDPAGVVEALLLDSLPLDSLLVESLFAPVESPEEDAAPSEELPEAVDAAADFFFLSASRLSLR